MKKKTKIVVLVRQDRAPILSVCGDERQKSRIVQHQLAFFFPDD